MQNLKWKCIYYYEELDTDNSILFVESTFEAPYRNGYLIKNSYDDLNGNIGISICFAVGVN